MSETREDFEARLARTLRTASPRKTSAQAAPAPEALVPPAPAPETPAALPEWYTRRMSRGSIAHAPTPVTPAAGTGPNAPRTTRGMPEGLATESNARGEFGVRIERFPAEFVHGSAALGEVLTADGSQLSVLTGDASLREFDPRQATFLDIETTGLSGGAGTQVFQVGLLTYEGAGFELWQGFLRSPAEAPALLEACAARVRRRGALVSFFGKSFDRHRLEDQMRLHGVEPSFAGRPHLDLYHPCRRLYGKRFVDGRLATMERELCGVEREKDLPGAFAPAAWFDFLAGRAHALEAVFLHNRIDVLSLVRLCSHVARVLDDDLAERKDLAQIRAEALTVLFATRRDWLRVLEWSARALDENSRARPTLAFRARALQRTGHFPEALALFEQVASSARDGLAAEAWAEVSVLACRLGELDRAQLACGSGESMASVTLAGTRRARLDHKLLRVRSNLAKGR